MLANYDLDLLSHDPTPNSGHLQSKANAPIKFEG